MKAIVEWGHPKAATRRKICGISGQFVVPNPEQGCQLAHQLFHTMVEGLSDSFMHNTSSWRVSKTKPRKVVWSEDNTVWVAVSLLDGVARGPYAGVADRDYQARIKEQAAEELDQ